MELITNNVMFYECKLFTFIHEEVLKSVSPQSTVGLFHFLKEIYITGIYITPHDAGVSNLCHKSCPLVTAFA